MKSIQTAKEEGFDLFISHSSSEKNVTVHGRSFNLIEYLKRQLEKHYHPTDRYNGRPKRFRVCTYEEDFELRKNVPEAIQNSLKSSGAMLLICSQAAAKSDWVQSEVQYFTKYKEDRPLLAGVWNFLPEKAFPEYFSTDHLAADLAPSISWSYKNWLKKLQDECHKIVAKAWQLPLKEVYDRFELDNKKRRSKLFRLAVSAIIVCAALIGLTVWQGISIFRDKAHREAINALKTHGYQIDEGGVNQTVELIFNPSVESEFVKPIHNHVGRGLKVAQKLRQIDSLRLNGTIVTDQTINELKALPSFRELWLHNAKVTDKSVQLIQSLDGLKALNVFRTQISADGIQRLRTKRPDIAIEYATEQLIDLSGWDFGNSLSSDAFNRSFRDISSKGLTDEEWLRIFEYSKDHAAQFGFPERKKNTLLIGSFNIRKLGLINKRSFAEWLFLAKIIQSFDLIAIQEVLKPEGIQFLLDLLGPSFAASYSPATGYASYIPDAKSRVFREHMVFIYNRQVVQNKGRGGALEIGSSHILESLILHLDEFGQVLGDYKRQMSESEARLDQARQENRRLPNRRNIFRIKLPVALDFYRTPYTETFVMGIDGAQRPYRILAVNCHLFWSEFSTIRWNEFELLFHRAVAESVERKGKGAGFEDVVIFGQLNFDYNNPAADREPIDALFAQIGGPQEPKPFYPNSVNFPFLDTHPDRESVFRTNFLGTKTYDHIGFIVHDERLPTCEDNKRAGFTAGGYDYGVFDYLNLIYRALNAGEKKNLTPEVEAELRKELRQSISFRVSDHVPLWVRLPIPD